MSSTRSHRPSTPFADVRPALIVAGLSTLTAAVWAAADTRLPGGRWMIVHLFTLGVLTPLILAFSQHFTRTLTKVPDPPSFLAIPAAVGAAGVLVGLVTETTWLLAVGGTMLLILVTDAYRRLRSMRKRAVGARFAWIVRVYERAHGAFVHGAILGVLLGTGVLPGAWYASARIAHLHVNILGWAGLTLLATIVFFGPSMVRARIADGVEERAYTAVRHGATALTVATILLLLTGIGGTGGTALRLLAALALAVVASAITVVCWPVVVVAVQARRSANWGLVMGSMAWFPLAAWADVAVVATGTWTNLVPIGVAALAGVLAQAVLATTTHVLPLLRAREGRMATISRLERLSTVGAVAWNVGTVAAVLAASELVEGTAGSVVATIGWSVLGVVIVLTAAVATAPVRATTGTPSG